MEVKRMMINKAYKFRIYPNKAQATLINKTMILFHYIIVISDLFNIYTFRHMLLFFQRFNRYTIGRILIYCYHARLRNVRKSQGFLETALGIVFSRIWVGVHYPFDVIARCVHGLLIALFTQYVVFNIRPVTSLIKKPIFQGKN